MCSRVAASYRHPYRPPERQNAERNRERSIIDTGRLVRQYTSAAQLKQDGRMCTRSASRLCCTAATNVKAKVGSFN